MAQKTPSQLRGIPSLELEEKASLGDCSCMAELARRLYSGAKKDENGIIIDKKEMAAIYSLADKSAKSNNGEGFWVLAHMCLDQNVPRSIGDAALEAYSMCFGPLGKIAADEWIRTINFKRAFTYATYANALGVLDAKFILGICHQHGLGGAIKDPILAAANFGEAGDRASVSTTTKLHELLSPFEGDESMMSSIKEAFYKSPIREAFEPFASEIPPAPTKSALPPAPSNPAPTSTKISNVDLFAELGGNEARRTDRTPRRQTVRLIDPERRARFRSAEGFTEALEDIRAATKVIYDQNEAKKAIKNRRAAIKVITDARAVLEAIKASQPPPPFLSPPERRELLTHRPLLSPTIFLPPVVV